MSHFLHTAAHVIARPRHFTPHTARRAVIAAAAVGNRPSFHTSCRIAAPSSLPSPPSLAAPSRSPLFTAASSHSHDSKTRPGQSIREEDDYQQQPTEQPKQPHSTPAHTSSTATNAAAAQSASPAFASLPADAHAYFTVPPSASSHSSTANPAHAGAAGVLLAGQPLVDMANDLTDHFMKAIHLSEQTRFVKGVVLGVSLLAVLSLSAYLFRDSVKTTTAEQVADVAKRSLADSDVKDQVNTLSQDVVHRLLTDQAVLSTALQFSQRLLHEPGTQTALLNLLQRMLADPKTLEWGKEFSTRLVGQLTADEKVQRQVAELVKGALMQDNNRESLITLLKDTVNDERSMAELRKVGSQSARDVMNDEAVQQRMTEFMKGVLADSSLQQQAGDALWGAVRHSIRPTWGKAAPHKDAQHKHDGKGAAAADHMPGASRPLSAPLGVEGSGGAPASTADGFRDAVLMPHGRAAAAMDASHTAPHSTSERQVIVSPTSTSPSPSHSSSHPTLSPQSPKPTPATDRPIDSPPPYVPVVHAPFAVASVDEELLEDLTPTFTINVNSHRAHAA